MNSSRFVAMPNHPLLGRIVEVRDLVYEGARTSPLTPNTLELVYEDGRTVMIEASGWDTDGLVIQE